MIRNNISLIGMAGVGKSTVGKQLAAHLAYQYVEVDALITETARKLGVNKQTLSDAGFIELEESVILQLADTKQSVIDTGGSVVYSEKAMALLKNISDIVYLEDNVENIKERFEKRGESHLIGIQEKGFEELFAERNKLYQKYADAVVEVSPEKSTRDIVAQIERNLSLQSGPT